MITDEYSSAVDLASAIKDKKIAPSEVMEQTIKAIDERNPSINAFVYTNYDEAMENAKKEDEALANGDAKGAFFGIPTAAKDFIPGHVIQPERDRPVAFVFRFELLRWPVAGVGRIGQGGNGHGADVVAVVVMIVVVVLFVAGGQREGRDAKIEILFHISRFCVGCSVMRSVAPKVRGSPCWRNEWPIETKRNVS